MVTMANSDADTSFHKSWYVYYVLYWGVNRKVEVNGDWMRAKASGSEEREDPFGFYGETFRSKVGPQRGKMECGFVPIAANGEQCFGEILLIQYVKLKDLE